MPFVFRKIENAHTDFRVDARNGRTTDDKDIVFGKVGPIHD